MTTDTDTLDLDELEDFCRRTQIDDSDWRLALIARVAAAEARNRELEAALQPFANAVYSDNGNVTIDRSRISTHDLRRARVLLSEDKP